MADRVAAVKNPMAAPWFSAQLRVLCLIENSGAVTQDDRVIIFRAATYDAAFERALEIGRAQEQEYLNGDGERVRWRLDRVVTLDMIRTRDLDGTEVHSHLSEVSGGASFDAVFRPEDHTPGLAGI